MSAAATPPTVTTPNDATVGQKETKALNWAMFAFGVSILSLAVSATNSYQTFFKDSQDLRLTPISFDESFLTKPKEIGFIVSNVGNKPAVLLDACLAFYDPNARLDPKALPAGKVADPGAILYAPDWMSAEHARQNFPRSIAAGETTTIYLQIPPALGTRAKRLLAIITRASSASGRTFSVDALIGSVDNFDPTTGFYRTLKGLNVAEVRLLSDDRIARQR